MGERRRWPEVDERTGGPVTDQLDFRKMRREADARKGRRIDLRTVPARRPATEEEAREQRKALNDWVRERASAGEVVRQAIPEAEANAGVNDLIRKLARRGEVAASPREDQEE